MQLEVRVCEAHGFHDVCPYDNDIRKLIFRMFLRELKCPHGVSPL